MTFSTLRSNSCLILWAVLPVSCITMVRCVCKPKQDSSPFITRAGVSIKAACTSGFNSFCVMEAVRVVNKMRVMKYGDVIDLEDLHRLLGGKLHTGRPEMLVVPTSVGRNMQVFRKGTIQILGNVSDDLANAMCREFEHRTHLRLPPMTISNLVMSARLKRRPCLSRIPYSNAHVFYEVEVFPAAMITTWKPAHVAIFHNGHVVVTGIKSAREGHRVLRRLLRMLE